MCRRLKLCGCVLGADTLIDGVGRRGSGKRKAVSPVSNVFDRVRVNFRMQLFFAVSAMHLDAKTAGDGMGFRLFACESGLRDFPEIRLMPGANLSLGGDGSSAHHCGDGVNLPLPGMEVGNRFLCRQRHSAKRQQKRNRQNVECNPHWPHASTWPDYWFPRPNGMDSIERELD